MSTLHSCSTFVAESGALAHGRPLAEPGLPERIPERRRSLGGNVSGANSAVELVKMTTVDKLATVASLSKDPAASLAVDTRKN